MMSKFNTPEIEIEPLPKKRLKWESPFERSILFQVPCSVFFFLYGESVDASKSWEGEPPMIQ